MTVSAVGIQNQELEFTLTGDLVENIKLEEKRRIFNR